ncbi:MAG: hypothetical protein NC200_04650 [Candidatus Gastranaerophilales bacterium]|nr:hypothetical protein [Candidatus Gastranaerophilales bacterium]
MEGVSNNVAARPAYKSTKKGTIVGAGIGAAVVGLEATAATCSRLPLKDVKTFADKKNYIRMMTDAYTARGIDMSKTTVSRMYKAGMKHILGPKNIITMLGVGAAVGAGIGLINDMIKNRKAANAEASAAETPKEETKKA